MGTFLSLCLTTTLHTDISTVLSVSWFRYDFFHNPPCPAREGLTYFTLELQRCTRM